MLNGINCEGSLINMNNKYKPKPDDRSDNAEKIEDMIGDTLSNINQTEDRMEDAPNKEKEILREKNDRRKEAIDGFKNEIQDEIEQ